MSASDVLAATIAVLEGLVSSTVFLLVLFIGFLVVAGLTKLRGHGGGAMVVRSLSERVDGRAVFLPPTAPRGPADQLHTPELAEHASPRAT